MCKKRILLVEDNLDGTIGGSYYALLNLIQKMDKSKFTPLVLFYHDNVLVPEYEKICHVIILEKKRGLVFEEYWPWLKGLIKKRLLIRYFLRLYQKTYNSIRYHFIYFIKITLILIRYKIDLVHSNNSPSVTDILIASKILRIKCISHIRGNWEPRTFQRYLVRYYDRVIFVSKTLLENLKRNELDTDNYLVIHDGIDIDAVKETKFLDKNKIIKDLRLVNCRGPVVGVIGNIKEWKGQHVAIEAIKHIRSKYPDIKCLIVGDTSKLVKDIAYYRYLKKMVDDNNLSSNIKFTGFRNDIPDIISILDILLHTSTEPEPFGLVLLEGMIYSKPVIATAHGGPLEIIEDGISGCLVEPNNPMELAGKIDYLLSNKEVSRVIIESARKRVIEHFNIEKNVNKITNIYLNLLS